MDNFPPASQPSLNFSSPSISRNIDTFPISRMNEYPREINVRYFKTRFWVYGVGEEAIPQIPPALYNAVFRITGKRFRTLPLKHHDVSWG